MLWLSIIPLSILAWYVRPLLPIDETRYLSVAYDMFTSGNYLVPHLNGELYSHKPPLLFWMMNLGWEIFGLNNWWPRMLGLIALFLNAHYLKKLSLLIWPEKKAVAINASQIFLTMFFPLVFSSLIFFDLWVSFFSLISLIAIFSFIRHRNFWPGALLLGAGIGFGILMKGPVILLFVMVPLLLRKAYTDVALFKLSISGFAIGLCIALAWAVPAAIAGGDAYSDAIFIKQTVARVASDSGGEVSGATVHDRPFWYFIALLPLLMIPWSFKRSFYTKQHHPFLISAVLPVIVIFSFIDGKQPHYLLPLFPLLALMISDKITRPKESESVKPAVLCLCLFAGALLVYGYQLQPSDFFPNRDDLQRAGIFLILATTLAYSAYRRRRRSLQFWLTVTPLLFISTYIALGSNLNKQYNMQPLADQARLWQDQGLEVAYQGSYHGQLNFIGRLPRPIHKIGSGVTVASFYEQYPDGKLIKIVGPEQVNSSYRTMPHGTRVAELH